MFKQTEPTDRSRSIVTRHRPLRKRRRQARLSFEQLERRNLLAVYIVNTVSDNNPTGIGEGSDNTGDLRYAIRMAASTLDEPDIIQFNLPPNSVIRPSAVPGLNIGPTGYLISDRAGVTIDGSGAPGLVIDGTNSVRHFAVAGASKLTLKNLELTNGYAKGGNGGRGGGGGGGGAGLGGSILVDTPAELTTEGVTFVNNTARGGDGGSGSSLGVDGGGDAGGGGGGGGMAGDGTDGQLIVALAIGGRGGGTEGGSGGNEEGGNGGFGSGGGGGGLTANQFGSIAHNGGDAGFGGGGGGASNGPLVTIAGINGLDFAYGGGPGFGGGAGGSTDRQAATNGTGGKGIGGAIFSNGGNVRVVDSTFVNNDAIGGDVPATRQELRGLRGFGGAIGMRNGSFIAIQSTFSENFARGGGGSIYLLSDASDGMSGLASATLFNNVIGQTENNGSEVTTEAIDNGVEPIVISINNFVTRHTGLPGVINAPGADPLLDRLSFNGGPTRTMAPMAGSPVLQAGNGMMSVSYADPTIDQQGVPRNVNAPTLGAVEKVSPPRVYVVNVANDRLNDNGTLIDFEAGAAEPVVTLRDALTAILTRRSSGNAPAGLAVNTILFSDRLRNATIALNSDLVSLVPGSPDEYGRTAFLMTAKDKIIIDGSNAPGLSISGQNSIRPFYVSGKADLTLRNLTLSNGYSNGGDVIRTIGGCSNGNCTVVISSSPAGKGGSVRVEGGTFTAEGVTFYRNKVDWREDLLIPAVGGAVFSNGGALKLLNSVFAENEAISGSMPRAVVGRYTRSIARLYRSS